MLFEEFTILLAGFLTLCIYSFLYKDNPLYRFAEHLYVGASAGYLFARGVNDVLYKKLWVPLLDPSPGTTPDYWLLIPIILGIFMILKLVPDVAWISRWAIALVVGGTIGLSMTTRFKSDVIKQVGATIKPFQTMQGDPFQSLNDLAGISKERFQFSGNPTDTLNVSNQYYLKFYKHLRYQLQYYEGNIPAGSPEFLSLKQSFDDTKKVLEKDLVQYVALSRDLTKMAQLHEQLLLHLEAELKKVERHIANFVTDHNAVQKDLSVDYLKENIFLMDEHFQNCVKALTKVKQRNDQIQKEVADFAANIQELADTVRLNVNFAFPSSSQDFIDSLKTNYDTLSQREKTQRQLLSIATLFSETAKNLGAFEADEELANSLGVPSAQGYFNSLGQWATSCKERLGEYETLMAADLSTVPRKAGGEFLKAFIIAFGVLTILIYFFFSTEHKGMVGVSAKIGIYFLMICFGSSFGYTIMARISLLIGRMQFLIGDFWSTMARFLSGA